MDKIWFMMVEGHEKGPFSLAQLKGHPELTPDTLVRKAGETDWKAARYVKELEKIFEDESPSDQENQAVGVTFPAGSEEMAIDAREDPPQFSLWLLLTLALLAYILFRMFENS